MNACLVYIQLLWIMVSGANTFDQNEMQRWVEQMQSVPYENQQSENTHQDLYVFQPEKQRVSKLNRSTKKLSSLFELKSDKYIPTDLLVTNKEEFWVAWHDQPGVKSSKLVKYDRTGRELREWVVELYGLNQLIGSKQFLVAKSGDVNERLETGIAVLNQIDPSKDRLIYVPGIIVFMEMRNESEIILISNGIEDGKSRVWILDAQKNELREISNLFESDWFSETKQLTQVHALTNENWAIVVRSIENNEETLYHYHRNRDEMSKKLLYGASHLFSVSYQRDMNQLVVGSMVDPTKGKLTAIDLNKKSLIMSVDLASFPTKLVNTDQGIFVIDEMSGEGLEFSSAMNQPHSFNLQHETWLVTRELE